MLSYKNNQLYVEGLSLKEIIKTYKTPFYIYSQESICKTFDDLKKSLEAEIFYSVKANSNLAIIKLMKNLGAGADVVSIGEMQRSLKAGIDPKKIIFEGVGKTNDDILFAIQKNIRLINIESIEELNQINLIAKSHNKKVNVGIRLNPNIDGKMIDKISTGKKTDKFGISIEKIKEIISIVQKTNNLNLIGISCHIGSQIHNIEIFKSVFEIMKETVDEFIQGQIPIKHLDLGGGFGINYSKKDPVLNLHSLNKLIKSLFSKVPYSISFEPGRFLMAKSGILITKIITTKSNGGINYLITDAGMHTFIRPSLYNAFHQIEALVSNNNFKKKYTVAGPICESTDILAKDIILSEQKKGDHLIVKDVGAYGAVMASNYNSRQLPFEILVNNNSSAIVYKPQSIEENIEHEIIPNWL